MRAAAVKIALKVVLMGLPEDCPPILITQHMPPRFTAAFAGRLNRECPMTVSEAQHGDVVEHGHVYIAPGSHHLELVKQGSGFACALNDNAAAWPNEPAGRPPCREQSASAASSTSGTPEWSHIGSLCS